MTPHRSIPSLLWCSPVSVKTRLRPKTPHPLCALENGSFGTWKGNCFSFWCILSHKLTHHSLEMPLFRVHRGSSGTRVKTAFLYLCGCDVRSSPPFVTQSQATLPQMLEPQAALPFPDEQLAAMKLCTHLGDFGKSPYSGIPDAGYIQNFHFLQKNKDKED